MKSRTACHSFRMDHRRPKASPDFTLEMEDVVQVVADTVIGRRSRVDPAGTLNRLAVVTLAMAESRSQRRNHHTQWPSMLIRPVRR